MDNDRNFAFFGAYLDAVEKLPEDLQLDALKAILRYGCDGTEPDDGTVAAMAVGLCKHAIDKGKQRREARSEAGQKGMQTRWSDNNSITNDNKAITTDNKGITKHSKDKDKDKDKDKENKEKESKEKERQAVARRLAPPSIEEVRSYCRERGNSVNAEQFVAFYESNGWKVGKNPMKDWKAAVRTWEQREAKSERPPNRFHNFDERKIDYDAMLWVI